MKYLTWAFAHSDEFFEADEVFDEDLYDTIVSIPEARHSHEMRELMIGLVTRAFAKEDIIATVDLLATIAKEEEE